MTSEAPCQTADTSASPRHAQKACVRHMQRRTGCDRSSRGDYGRGPGSQLSFISTWFRGGSGWGRRTVWWVEVQVHPNLPELKAFGYGCGCGNSFRDLTVAFTRSDVECKVGLPDVRYSIAGIGECVGDLLVEAEEDKGRDLGARVVGLDHLGLFEVEGGADKRRDAGIVDPGEGGLRGGEGTELAQEEDAGAGESGAEKWVGGAEEGDAVEGGAWGRRRVSMSFLGGGKIWGIRDRGEARTGEVVHHLTAELAGEHRVGVVGSFGVVEHWKYYMYTIYENDISRYGKGL